jgi:hypothetical protein
MNELRNSPAGFTSAPPHSLANIRNKTRERPIIIGIFLRAIQQWHGLFTRFVRPSCQARGFLANG